MTAAFIETMKDISCNAMYHLAIDDSSHDGDKERHQKHKHTSLWHKASCFVCKAVAF
jgi:predicted ferric reductase